ncbi:MAG TPA: sugar ABC transporter substrate-binding protein [Devosia sp.]|jgi:ribose transport system substrate-binding protein|uniref:sugar ABC transporter substrate-binding protein n=1 Tax=Devosia sp. TaxID=1871048 RepID=UPI002DDD8204|nr:sugar ABC transporter substrate-binding protein [Devosia sp.]HEV2516298.1 sugar ABC transporter substrate-binding protein [Devosia sp.]
MNISKRTLVKGLLGATALLASFGTAGASYAQEVNLLWVQAMKDHPVHRLMQAGFLDKCKELGYSCEVVGDPSATNWDIPATLPLAEAALSRTKFNAVGVYGPDPAIYSYITKLSKEGLPVVTWHVLPPEGTVDGLKAAAAQDIAAAGTNAAIAIGDKLGGKGTVALTQGASNDTENAMSDAFRKTIAEKYPDIKVLETQMEGFEPSAAEGKAIAILQGNPDVTAAFGTTGNSIQTWSGAARKTGRDVVIIGMDYIRQNLDLVKSGAAYGIVAQPLYEESAKVAELLGALAKGETVTYMNVLPSKVITATDLDPYYAMLESAGQ